jgi:hypothetical protein
MGTSDRRPYLTFSGISLTQSFLDEAHDNLTNQLELAVQINTPGANPNIFASDVNKYVAERFYEALLNFPVIKRTVGEFLDTTITFEELNLELNNTDGRYNTYLPAGDDFDGWIGRKVFVSLGLRDVLSTYTTIFEGNLTEEGGFERTTSSIKLKYRNRFDVINKAFPTTILAESTFPDIEDENKNITVPYIYGDWTTAVEPGSASIPALVVNGASITVNDSDEMGSPNSDNVECVISQNANRVFDEDEVYLVRGDIVQLMDGADIVNVNGDKNEFEVRQVNTTPASTTQIELEDGSLIDFAFTEGDKFFVKVEGKDVGATYQNNAVVIAKDILVTFTGLNPSLDFDVSWDNFKDKASPSESAVKDHLCRVWLQEPTSALEYALSLMEQVRLEIFVNRENNLALSSLHLDNFQASPTFDVRNWDIEEDSFQPKLDERNNFNRTKAVYNFLPNRGEELAETVVYRNDDAITQAGKDISKKIVYPNLYVESTVTDQLQETLRIASGYIENINCTLTWRSMLLDIGDFVKLNVDIDGTVFEDVPAMVREIGYDPDGIKIPVRLWSFQMLPFGAYTPGYAGTTGGSTATITVEV